MVTGGSVTMTNWQTFTLPCISNALSLDAYILHRYDSIELRLQTLIFVDPSTCDPGTPQIRRMIYHYLLSIHRNIIQMPGRSSQETSDKAEVGKAIQLFDRLLIEDYTQGSPEHETRLLQPNSCDFCGADIFNAAFICSNTRALSEKIILPVECCEVVLCPSCCVEGRSCLCGKLRLCVMHDFEELLSMRNDIRQWCGVLDGLEYVISAKEIIDERYDTNDSKG
jgi:hypothetical protein